MYAKAHGVRESRGYFPWLPQLPILRFIRVEDCRATAMMDEMRVRRSNEVLAMRNIWLKISKDVTQVDVIRLISKIRYAPNNGQGVFRIQFAVCESASMNENKTLASPGARRWY